MTKEIPVNIRKVHRSDFDALRLFFLRNDQPAVKRYFHPFPLDSDSAIRIACTDHLDLYCVAINHEGVIGLSMLRGWDEGFDVPSFGVLVDFEHYGCGLGRRMTEQAISEAEKRGCRSLRLSVYDSNKRAVRLYESLGFVEIRREPVLVKSESDQKIIMVRDFAP